MPTDALFRPAHSEGRNRRAIIHLVDTPEAQRMRLALDMYEMGETLLRGRLRRERPTATSDDIDAEVRAWLLRRPGAVYGDSAGRPSHRFE
jgi:Rv0078B-related antitoxin